MRIAILDPAAGISGDMTLGALLSLGIPVSWLQELPKRLGLDGVAVTVRDVRRTGIMCKQIEFAIPDQPHGRYVGALVRLVEQAPVSDWVKQRAVRAFQLVGEAEGRVHAVVPEKVHLHEVGAVDAVLDIVGGIEGFEKLGVGAVYHLPVAVGQGWVETAHGQLPVPAPATAILLEGVEIAADGPVIGEATTPTGAALLRVLSAGAPPERWRMVGSGWGAGQRDPKHYPNALRILIAEAANEAGRGVLLATDVDDMSPEYVEPLRQAVVQGGGAGVGTSAARGGARSGARRRGSYRESQGVNVRTVRNLAAIMFTAVTVPLAAQQQAGGAAGRWADPKCDLKPGHFLVNQGVLFLKSATTTRFYDEKKKKLHEA